MYERMWAVSSPAIAPLCVWDLVHVLLWYLMWTQDLVRSAQLVHESMPSRIARRIQEMNNLPYGPCPAVVVVVVVVLALVLVHSSLIDRCLCVRLSSTLMATEVMLHPDMQTVYDFFHSSFVELIEFPQLKTSELEHKFTEFLPSS